MVMITITSSFGSRSEGSSPSESSIHDWIEITISIVVREMILEFFGTIKTELIAMFDEQYVFILVLLPPPPLLVSLCSFTERERDALSRVQ